MKLRTKPELHQAQTLEKKQQIDRGLMLANRVDELRIAKAKEEADLTKWREETLRIVQKEIDDAIEKRNQTLKQVKEAEEARFKVQAPLDVQEEREKNRRLSKENEKTTSDLLNRETLVIHRESTVLLTQKDQEKRNGELEESERRAQKYLDESKIFYDEASVVKAEAQKAKDASDSNVRKRSKDVEEKEQAVSLAEKNIQNQWSAIKLQQEEIAKEKAHIESQQQTLKATWQAIKRLQK